MSSHTQLTSLYIDFSGDVQKIVTASQGQGRTATSRPRPKTFYLEAPVGKGLAFRNTSLSE